MPCSLAVSITKAAVSNEQLLKLLTPDVVTQAVKNFLSRHETYKDELFGDWQDETTVIFYVGDCVLHIENGKITVTGTQWATEQANALSADMTTLISRLADYLFAQQVQQALARLGPVGTQVLNVDDQGITRQATVLTLNV